MYKDPEDIVIPDIIEEDDDDEDIDELTALIGEVELHPMERLTLEDFLLKTVNEEKRLNKENMELARKAVAFGSKRERLLYDQSEFNIGPTAYDIDQWTSMFHVQEKLTSVNKKGWGFGNLTGSRSKTTCKDHNIGPGQYEKDIACQEPEQRKPPFSIKQKRFKKMKSTAPGPGIYDPKFFEIGKRVMHDTPKTKHKAKVKLNWGYEARTKRKRKRLEEYFNLYS